jgi:S-(hydroxymethyl)glutathione dehydrogenase/alcohol dehydrogenase
MKALTFQGVHNVEIKDVRQPDLMNAGDAIVRITSAGICGSDLHIYHGLVPAPRGMVMGHELMGVVEAVGPEVTKHRPGERVIIAFPIACGHCIACENELYSLCYESNPDGITAGIYGYGHLYGPPYQGGFAEYLRVPYADVGLLTIPEDIDDERVVMMGCQMTTGWFACENAAVTKGDDVAIMGCGPVGLNAIQSAFLHGARRVFVVDHIKYRLDKAANEFGAEPINIFDGDVSKQIEDRTDGLGVHCAIDACGMFGTMTILEKAQTALHLDHGTLAPFRQAVESVRRGGRIAIIGDYAATNDNFPMGHVMNKGLTIRSGQCPVQRYWTVVLDHVRAGRLQPEKIVTHRMPLDDAAKGFRIFDKKEDNCIKVVLKVAD